MIVNKNRNSPWSAIWSTIKLVAIAVLIVAILGIAANFMTAPVVKEPAKEEMWAGVPTIKVLFSGSTYPDIKDVTSNPALAGIEVTTENNNMAIKNLNKDFIAVSGTVAITEIVAPGKNILMPLSKEVFVSFPDPRIIRGGPETYYFDFDLRALY